MDSIILADVLKAVLPSNADHSVEGETKVLVPGHVKKELHANIDKILGQGFAQQMLDIKSYTDGALLDLKTKIKFDMLEKSVQVEFRAFEQRIEETLLRLSPWLKEPDHPMAQREFLDAYRRNDPAGAVHWLHCRLTNAGVGRTLTEDIATSCGQDWRQFLIWEQHIHLRLSQACSLEIAYHKITAPKANKKHAKRGNVVSDVSN